ncbi:major facilitator superfamily domain-containing protein [Mycena floridula]|nr:major facilitator superfamily domain-containing protein [Mycena floridula]
MITQICILVNFSCSVSCMYRVRRKINQDIGTIFLHLRTLDFLLRTIMSSSSLNGPKDPEHDYELDLAQRRSVLRKIDLRVLPLLAACYCMALTDRSNLGLARTAGMGDALGLSIASRYSIVSAMYFVTYIVFQLPGNLVLRSLGPRVLSLYVICWGAAQLSMGFTKNWQQLLVCRLLLGAFEGGFFPGLVFIVSTWYKRHEVHKRLAIFYLCSYSWGAFTPILVYGITFMDGLGGLAGWQWIFVILGIITVLLGSMGVLYLPDFPDRNKFLTVEETKYVLERLEIDRGDSLPDTITWPKIRTHLGDWTIWAHGAMFMCSTMPSYAIAFFLPIILASMGWGEAAALLLSAPPYIFAAILSFLFAWLSDKAARRAPYIAVQALITMVGLFISMYTSVDGVRYFGLFLVIGGASSSGPAILAYNANNSVSHSKRSVATAVVMCWGGVGGILATTVFRQQDYPRYTPGMWATVGCQLLMLLLLCITTITYHLRNRLAREGKIMLEGQPNFYYTL